MEMVCHLPHIHGALRSQTPNREQYAQLRSAEPDTARNGSAQGLHPCRHGEKVGDEVAEFGVLLETELAHGNPSPRFFDQIVLPKRAA
jgi:hypothetical protein